MPAEVVRPDLAAFVGGERSVDGFAVERRAGRESVSASVSSRPSLAMATVSDTGLHRAQAVSFARIHRSW